MKLEELRDQAGRLNPEDQRKLIGFLVAMDVRREEGGGIGRELDDTSEEGWINLKEVERRLKNDGV